MLNRIIYGYMFTLTVVVNKLLPPMIFFLIKWENNLSVSLGNDVGTESVDSCWKIDDIKSK